MDRYLPIPIELDNCINIHFMGNEMYLFHLQGEYLRNSKAYMDALKEGWSLYELKMLASELRSLLTEIKAV